MKLLIDTNVILDIALQRVPFAEQASRLFRIAQQQSLHLFITATTVTDLYYISRKEKGKDTALAFLKDLLQFVDVASVDKHVILDALYSEMTDLEDAVQAYSARQENITTIVTRNEKDFAKSGLIVHSPVSFLESMTGSGLEAK